MSRPAPAGRRETSRALARKLLVSISPDRFSMRRARSRWIAERYGCHVTGVDLTPEFCVAARELNAATGLADRVTILHASALALPVPEESFRGAEK
jgi:hypothetical protein